MNLTNEEYHNRPEISKSDLDLIAYSPYHFKHKAELREEKKTFDIGTAVHTLVLEPHLFDEQFTVETIDRRTKAGKERYKEITESGVILLSEDEYEQVKAMANSVLNSTIGKLIKNGEAEQTFFGEIDEVKVRCRPDYYRQDIGLVIDLKTTTDATKDGFAKSCGQFNYFVQDAFYSEIIRQNNLPVKDFIFIAVEKKPPYFVGAYRLGLAERELGVEHYTKILDKYKVCLDKDDFGTNEYTGINTVTGEIEYVQDITLPNWVFYKEI